MVKWDFDSDEVREFRYESEKPILNTKENEVRSALLFQENAGVEVAATKYLPKFINKIENYKLKYTFVRK